MQTLLLRKTAFDATGGFSSDQTLTGLDDTEFFIRLLCSGIECLYVPGVFGRWVSHARNYSKSAEFQDARLALLRHLKELQNTLPPLREILPELEFSIRYMRGLFFVEHNQPRLAVPELGKAFRLKPSSFDAAYLLAKALLLSPWKSIGR